ncbi:hypothetical protein Ddye_028046 [Dipteronia dyeriana]|uniref:Disease resistance N-terminal domain-containing protein n=1 Tax=Dipteronia dyeriana TaxID=168575 RepID=A0AAD9TQX8_9ROSI|nr:hypothetical protein Ddye_028046 [Dipteronia dyeriana]
MKDELGWMQCYIASAEEKEDDNGQYIVRKWLTGITKIAYDAEDVLDYLILQVHHKRMSAGCFPSMSCCIKCREKVNLRDLGKDNFI